MRMSIAKSIIDEGVAIGPREVDAILAGLEKAGLEEGAE